MRIVQLLFGVWVGICFLACGEKSDSFTREERERIGHLEEEGIMPLFLVTNRVDSLFLRLQAILRESGNRLFLSRYCFRAGRMFVYSGSDGVGISV